MNSIMVCWPIVQPREVREKLSQLKPTDQVTVDLERQNHLTGWRNSLSKSMARETQTLKWFWMISILLLQYEDLIAA